MATSCGLDLQPSGTPQPDSIATRIATLPRELRDMIYEQMIGSSPFEQSSGPNDTIKTGNWPFRIPYTAEGNVLWTELRETFLRKGLVRMDVHIHATASGIEIENTSKNGGFGMESEWAPLVRNLHVVIHMGWGSDEVQIEARKRAVQQVADQIALYKSLRRALVERVVTMSTVSFSPQGTGKAKTLWEELDPLKHEEKVKNVLISTRAVHGRNSWPISNTWLLGEPSSWTRVEEGVMT